MKKTIPFSLSLSFFLLFLVGCGGGIGVGGKVVFSDDGSPLTVGTVYFETDSHSARGDLKPDGTFTIGSLTENDGVPAAGTYRVYIVGAQKPTGQQDGIDEVYEPLIDSKYTSSRTSGITIDVKSSKKDIEIKVERYDPAKR